MPVVSAVGTVIVVVPVPHFERGSAFGFGAPDARVKKLFGEDPVVALDFAVVSRRVWRDALVSTVPDCVVESCGSVAGTVVGHDPLDPGDAVLGEPSSCTSEERDGSGGFLVRQRFGVRESGVPVDGRMQVDVPSLRTPGLLTCDSFGFLAAFAVHTPPAAIRDTTDLLHVQVHHVAGTFGGDALRFPIQLAVGVNILALVQAQLREEPGDGATTDRCSCLLELECDTGRWPFLFSSH